MRPLIALALVACAGTPETGNVAVTTLTPTLALDLPMDQSDSVVVGMLQDATRLSDGRMALLDVDRDLVVVVDSAGRRLMVVGGPGAGPGEFQMPTWLERCAGDSLFVFDPGIGRMSVFAPGGQFVRQFRPAVTRGLQMTCDRHGRLAAFDVSHAPLTPPVAGKVQPILRGALVVMGAEGDSVAAIPDLPLGQSQAMGSLAAAAFLDGGIVLGISSSPELRIYSIEGEAGATIALPIEPRPATDSLYDVELDRMSGLTGATGEMRARIRQMLAAAERPEFAPHYQVLRASDDGTLWLVTSLPTDPATTVLGHRSDGGLVTFTLPMTVEVHEIGDDYLLGKRIDEEGSERLVMWRW